MGPTLKTDRYFRKQGDQFLSASFYKLLPPVPIIPYHLLDPINQKISSEHVQSYSDLTLFNNYVPDLDG